MHSTIESLWSRCTTRAVGYRKSQKLSCMPRCECRLRSLITVIPKTENDPQCYTLCESCVASNVTRTEPSNAIYLLKDQSQNERQRERGGGGGEVRINYETTMSEPYLNAYQLAHI